MRIAIIGAGFAGLAVAYHLLQKKNIQVDLYDPNGIGGAASGISAGLLHPYAGLHAKLNWRGQEGLEATEKLLHDASAALGQPVAFKSGLLRLAITPQNERDYIRSASKNSDLLWLDAQECQKRVPGIAAKSGLWIAHAWRIDGLLYLEGLWNYCAKRGAILKRQAIDHLAELKDYDRVVVAVGASSKHFPELQSLPITAIKGQILELAWPSGLPLPPFPLSAQAYIIPLQASQSCIVGATYERVFETREADRAVASSDIMPKVAAVMQALSTAKILNCQSGFRASTPDHRPIVRQLNEKCWVFVGLGSKGLLYHALFAQELSEAFA